MNESFLYLFGILFFAVIVWFILCNRMFGALKTRHPVTYDELGKPSLFMNNNIGNNLSFLRFLFSRGWQNLDDSQLATLGNSMLVFFVAYLIGFAYLFIMILTGNAS